MEQLLLTGYKYNYNLSGFIAMNLMGFLICINATHPFGSENVCQAMDKKISKINGPS